MNVAANLAKSRLAEVANYLDRANRKQFYKVIHDVTIAKLLAAKPAAPTVPAVGTAAIAAELAHAPEKTIPLKPTIPPPVSAPKRH